MMAALTLEISQWALRHELGRYGNNFGMRTFLHGLKILPVVRSDVGHVVSTLFHIVWQHLAMIFAPLEQVESSRLQKEAMCTG